MYEAPSLGPKFYNSFNFAKLGAPIVYCCGSNHLTWMTEPSKPGERNNNNQQGQQNNASRESGEKKTGKKNPGKKKPGKEEKDDGNTRKTGRLLFSH